MPIRLEVPADLLTAMVKQAQMELPNECCGLLAGTVQGGTGRITRCYPLVNEAASPVEFVGAARGLLDAFKDMRRLNLDLLAVYHSHPTSAPVPSRKDLERNYYGEEAACVIISLAGQEPEVRAWWLRATDFLEADWFVMHQEAGRPPHPQPPSASGERGEEGVTE
jgi:[CysO sulfur-carrier protein]-S-L-cysteine hydrolase